MTVHYQDKVDTEDTSHCEVCGAVFHAGTEASRERLLQHLALRHTVLLVWLMERDGLWVGREEVFREGERGFQSKAVRVEVGKITDLRIL